MCQTKGVLNAHQTNPSQLKGTTMKNHTRREFLKTSAKIGATMALANFGIGTLLANEAIKKDKIPNLTLNNGVMMPIIGLGTV